MSEQRDKDGQPQGFKVSDRRKRHEEPSDATGSTPAPGPPEQPAAPGAASAPTETRAAGGNGADAGAAPPGPADFLQLVGKLYQEGLAFMGLFDDPQAGQPMANFAVASWHIDVLGILREKTQGNLTPEESKLLEEAIANLKLMFVRASGFLKH